MKLLIIRFSSIGDIVLTTPVVRCLKHQLKDVEIHYLTKRSFKEIIETNPYVDKTIYLKDNWEETIRTLKQENYDYIIDLHHNLRTMRIKQALKTSSKSFSKLNIQKWLLVNFKINLMPATSIVERYMETVSFLGVENDGKGLDYFIPKEVEQKTLLPETHKNGYIACVIGGSYHTKKFPVEKWIALLEKIAVPAILLGGKDDNDEGMKISSVNSEKIFNGCGKFLLNESAKIVRDAEIVISNDTGLMHVAAAFEKKIVSFWGNTSPEMGMFPYFGGNDLKRYIEPTSFLIENKALYCHPCSKLGYAKCPKGHFRCMNELNVELITEIIKKNR